MGYYSAINKEQGTDKCCNMDESWKYYKWKQLDTKGHVLYDTIYMKWPLINKQT